MNNIVVTTFLIAVSVAGAFLYVIPQYQDLGTDRQSRIEYVDSIEKVNIIQEKFEEAKKWRSTIRNNDLERLDIILPDEFNNVEFLLDLENMAVTNGINVGEVDIAKQSDPDAGYATYAISFSFDAPYSGGIEAFMQTLENSLTIFDVTELQMDVNDETGLITYSLSFNTYAQK